MVLLGVTYSQFDNIVGTKLQFCHPHNAISSETFESLSDYVIVGKHLCGRILIVTTDDLQFVNYSIAIENSKYERNALLFSFGFILSPDVDTEPYEPILRKVSNIFLRLELEKEFLFQEITRNCLPVILQELFDDLCATGEAFRDVDPSNVLAIRLSRSTSLPCTVNDSDVPMLCVEKLAIAGLPWDISIRHLLEHIDGVTYVKKIGNRSASMEVDIVKKCLRVLAYYHCIILSDIFQFSNIYRLTAYGKNQILNLSESPMLPELLQFCSIDKSNLVLPSVVANLQRFFFSLRAATNISTIATKLRTMLLGFNIRRLLAYGQHRGLIKRIHGYPVDLFLFSRANFEVQLDNGAEVLDLKSSLSRKTYLLGLSSMDAICVAQFASPAQIMSIPSVCLIMK